MYSVDATNTDGERFTVQYSVDKVVEVLRPELEIASLCVLAMISPLSEAPEVSRAR